MPISSKKFEKFGKDMKRRKVQINVLMVLDANQGKALSSKELGAVLRVRRQGIHQALRALESRGLIERGMVEEKPRSIYYAVITEEGVRYVKERKESNAKASKSVDHPESDDEGD